MKILDYTSQGWRILFQKSIRWHIRCSVSLDGQTESSSSWLLEHLHLNCAKWKDFRETEPGRRQDASIMMDPADALDRREWNLSVPRIQKALALGVMAHISQAVPVFPLKGICLCSPGELSPPVCVLKSRFWHSFWFPKCSQASRPFICLPSYLKAGRSLSYY